MSYLSDPYFTNTCIALRIYTLIEKSSLNSE